MQDWKWSERYPEQLEILRYLEHVAKRHDLKCDMATTIDTIDPPATAASGRADHFMIE